MFRKQFGQKSSNLIAEPKRKAIISTQNFKMRSGRFNN
jgi:hypothetical protein